MIQTVDFVKAMITARRDSGVRPDAHFTNPEFDYRNFTDDRRFEQAEQVCDAGVYGDRTPGGHREHCDSGRHAVAGVGGGQGRWSTCWRI